MDFRLDYVSRVRSFAVAFNYLILAYLRLNYLRLIYAQFCRHFLTTILLFLVLGCIIIIIIALQYTYMEEEYSNRVQVHKKHTCIESRLDKIQLPN